jgi:hypothetical protein
LVKNSDSDYDVEWGASGGSSSAGGSNTQVQFNDGGALAGDSGLTYNKTTDRLTAGSLALNTITNATTDTDKFLVSDGGVLKYRTGAEVLSDIGGGGGGGISTLNTLTASTQTFAVGTTGTDFNISSVTFTHTFNIPTSSGTNRGLLSSTDWTTFNNKFSPTLSTNGSKVLAINSGETAVEYIATTSFSASDFGYKTFLDLTDTPSSYSAKAGFVAAVNSGATALEFVATTDVSSYFPIGVQDLFIQAVEMYPTTTNGCAAIASSEVTNVTFRSLDFDQTTEENAQVNWSFPRNWDRGVIAIKAYWTAASGTGGVAIGFKGIALSDDDPLSGSFGSEVIVTDTLIATNDLHITSYSANITIGGTPADCIRVAISHIAEDINYVISGINAGGNLGVDAYISGTVAAVREAAMHGIPGIAVSQYRQGKRDYDWDTAVK